MDAMKAMQNRHSVRRYTERPLEGAALARLEGAVAAANRDGGLHIQLVKNEPGAFTGLLPHYGGFRGVQNYLALVGAKADDLSFRAGYYGERIVLEAQDAGLNTCWVGGGFNRRKASYEVGPGERLVCLIAVGYGDEAGRSHRSKPLEKCCELGGRAMPDWFARGMDAALLAPTALNQQRFKFMLQGDGSVRAASTGGFFADVDLGIVVYHFEVASGHTVETR